ncbi:MAG: 5'-nucleotidase C-terminal domain-containing protein, partial [bacterium]
RLLPVFANLITADPIMSSYIDEIRKPFAKKLNEELATAETLLYRRGNFNGTFDQVICDALLEQLNAEISLSPGFRWGTSVLPGDQITMERVLDQTCITYPETYARNMKGAELKQILESVADNLFTPDPYYQQGGDMVRTGGINYVCTPGEKMGNRISNMTLRNGSNVEPNKDYKVAGWATVGSQAPGEPIWDVVADHLRSIGTVKLASVETPLLRGSKSNPGIADYAGIIQ